MTPRATEAVAAWVTGLRYADLPPDAVRLAKEAILDCVGVSLAGATQPMGRIVTGYVADQGGAPVAGVLGGGFRTSPEQAALVGGVLGHALDFDDTWAPPADRPQETASHPTCTVVPVLLSLGEMLDASGAELLTAFVAGLEVHGKVGFPGRTTVRAGFHGSSVFGALGAAAAAARLLRLDVAQTRMALGLAAANTAGLNVNRGTMAKPYQVGNVAAGAVRAALLVRRGYTAALDGIEGHHGFAHNIMDPRHWDEAALISSLGSPLSIVDPGVEMKKYASCFFTHRAIDAAVQLARDHDVDPERVAAVTVVSSPGSIVNRPDPASGLAAKFSLQFTVAEAILERQVGYRSFTDERLNRPAARELMKRVTVREDPGLTSDYARIDRPVTITLDSGEVLADPVRVPGGGWSTPMGRDDLVAKYVDNASEVLGAAVAAHSAEEILRMETLASVAGLAATLTGPPHDREDRP